MILANIVNRLSFEGKRTNFKQIDLHLLIVNELVPYISATFASGCLVT